MVVDYNIIIKVPPEGIASNSDEALFDDVIRLVMSSFEHLVMMSSHCVHLAVPSSDFYISLLLRTSHQLI